MEEESWRGDHGESIIEEAARRRQPGGTCRHPGGVRKHPGGPQEATGGSRRHLSIILNFLVEYLFSLVE